MTFLSLRDLTRVYAGEGTAKGVQGVSLEMPRGEVLALLGPSGSGKTTTLRLLAGFERPDRGQVVVDGKDVTLLSPAERHFGMVFQHYALFPHLSVGENVAFGLSNRSGEPAKRRVSEVLELVDLAGFDTRRVTELSGGQQQRVAVARALAPQPRVLLLDEPLSNLDPTLRERTRRELKVALAKTGITTVFVTHEQDEAFALGDRVAVLQGGLLEQIGSPEELYDRPASLFVATFVGRGSVLPGTLAGLDRAIVGDGVTWPVELAQPMPAGARVRVVVRPEGLEFGATGLEGTVVERRYTGARALFRVEASGALLEVEAPFSAAQVGDAVKLNAKRARAFPA
ncbi:MAG TPA: ABC transporter ATP-binding protein [Gemmatimonadales bacterium]